MKNSQKSDSELEQETQEESGKIQTRLWFTLPEYAVIAAILGITYIICQ